MDSDYPFLDVLLSMLVFFVWAAWFVMLFWVITNIFRRQDLTGGGKVLWLVLVVALPYLGVFLYIVLQGGHLATTSAAPAVSPTEEIARAKALLDSGAITSSEYEALKSAALPT
jgi:hypothetical protein